MADGTRDYLDHFARRTADNVAATVESRNDDGTYMVREIGSRALQRAARATVDEYTPGERVMISRPAATRTVVGAQPVIISRAPREQRGLSATTPAEERNTRSRVAIISVDPDPLEIRAGGDAGVQTITGVGFAGEEPVYVASTEGGTDPTLTNESAPTLSDTEAVMTIAADRDSARGEFDVVVNGARARRALRILRPLPMRLLLIAGNKRSGASSGTWVFIPTVWMVNADTLELVAEWSPFAGDSSMRAGPLAIGGNVVYQGIKSTGGNSAGELTLSSGTALGTPPVGGVSPDPDPFVHWDSGAIVASVGGESVLIVAGISASSATRGLFVVTADGGTATQIYNTTSLHGAADTGVSFVCSAGTIMHEVWNPDDGSGVRASTNLGTTYGEVRRCLIYNGYVIAIASSAIMRFPVGGGGVDTVTIPGAAVYNGTADANRPWDGVIIGTTLYFILETSRIVYALNLSTFSGLTEVVTLPADTDEYGTVVTYRYIATDGASLFVVGRDRKVRKIDPTTAAVTVGAVFWPRPDLVNNWVGQIYQLAMSDELA